MPATARISTTRGTLPRELRSREILFRAAAAGEHRLYVGDRTAAPPRYDLSEILAHAERAEPSQPAALGPLAQNPRFDQDEPVAPSPVTERYSRSIGVALAALLLALSGWAVWLLRRPGGDSAPSA